MTDCQYPTIGMTSFEKQMQARQKSPSGELDRSLVQWVGVPGPPKVDLQACWGAKESMRAQISRLRKKKDHTEGYAAVSLYEAIDPARIPLHVIADPGFWRFLALEYFWEFVYWREQETLSRGAGNKYVDAQKFTISVLPRMWLRVQSVGGLDYKEYASGKAMDYPQLWQQYIFRHDFGIYPHMVRALLDVLSHHKILKGDLPKAIRDINCEHSNIVFACYSYKESYAFIEHLWRSHRYI